MDGQQFDTLTRVLTRDASRRRIFSVWLGAAVAITTGSTAMAARRKRKKRNDSGDEIDEEPVLPGTQVGGVWDETIDICHFDAEGGFRVMTVSAPSLPNYLELGDTLYIDCCVVGDCAVHPCGTTTDCIEGACMYEFSAGAPCPLGNGLSGVCDKTGLCYEAAPVTTAQPLPEAVAPAA